MATPETLPTTATGVAPVPGSNLRFAGVTQAVAGEDWVHVSWSPAHNDGEGEVRYRVYADPDHVEPELMQRALDSAPGATHCRLTGLSAGTTLQILVRALDSDGREDSNRVILRATPNPVRYVVAGQPSGGDGQSPATAYGSVLDAMEELLGRPGLNLYLAGEGLRERVLLFEGMALYGGFGPDFRIEDRRPLQTPTLWQAAGESDLVVVAPGKRWCVLDGLELSGGGKAGRAIVADDCRLQLNQVRIHGFRRMGLHVRGEEDSYSMARVRMQACEIHDNAGEGVSIRGITDVQVVSSTIRNNAQEGIEAKPLTPGTGRAAELRVVSSRIQENQDAGVDVNVELLEDSRRPLGPVRILVQDCELTGNQGTGVTLDLQVHRDDALDLSLDVTGNQVRDNGGGGIHVDVDAPGRILLRDNQVTGCEGAGLQISGDDATAVVITEATQVHDNRGQDLMVTAAATILQDTDTATDDTLPTVTGSWPYPVSLSPPPVMPVAAGPLRLTFASEGQASVEVECWHDGRRRSVEAARAGEFALSLPAGLPPGEVIEVRLVPETGPGKTLHYRLAGALEPGSESAPRLPCATSQLVPAEGSQTYRTEVDAGSDLELLLLRSGPGPLEVEVRQLGGTVLRHALTAPAELLRLPLPSVSAGRLEVQVHNRGPKPCPYHLALQERVE